MIRINLIPQKRAKRSLSVGADATGREMMMGIGAIAAMAMLVFLVVDNPKRSRLAALEDSNAQLAQDIAAKKKQLNPPGEVGYEDLQKAFDELMVRGNAIKRLNAARIVPANLLHELGQILTAGQPPTMTEEMTRKTTGTNSDPNKRFDLAWDPTHVWLTSIADQTDGTFKIDGGAQTEVDITQLSKRLAASAYFKDIGLAYDERVSDKDSGIDYFRFTITGKAAY
jgi:Tfp pilus assembly protein PilN